VNSVGESPASAEASATPGTQPGAPTNLTAQSATVKGVNLSWMAPAPSGPAVTSYRVYRGTVSGGETFLVTVACTTDVCSYHDAQTGRLKTYYYKVSAVNSVGEGPKSNEASALAH